MLGQVSMSLSVMRGRGKDHLASLSDGASCYEREKGASCDSHSNARRKESVILQVQSTFDVLVSARIQERFPHSYFVRLHSQIFGHFLMNFVSNFSIERPQKMPEAAFCKQRLEAPLHSTLGFISKTQTALRFSFQLLVCGCCQAAQSTTLHCLCSTTGGQFCQTPWV